MELWDEYPASAASSFRGIPNLVFRSDDGGAGHSGHDKCESTWQGPNQIATQSLSRRWAWHWAFYDTFAELSVDRVDSSHAYWFLYEGTPGGRFAPAAQYFGTEQGGPRYDQLDYYANDKEFARYRWAYFGDTTVEQVLFIDRWNPTPCRTPSPMTRPHRFVVGFWPQAVRNAADHQALPGYVEELLER